MDLESWDETCTTFLDCPYDDRVTMKHYKDSLFATKLSRALPESVSMTEREALVLNGDNYNLKSTFATSEQTIHSTGRGNAND